MKALLLLIATALMILAARIAFDAGARTQHQLDELCSSPGVRCEVEVTPEFLEAHGTDDPGLDDLPLNWAMVLGEGKGGVR